MWRAALSRVDAKSYVVRASRESEPGVPSIGWILGFHITKGRPREQIGLILRFNVEF